MTDHDDFLDEHELPDIVKSAREMLKVRAAGYRDGREEMQERITELEERISLQAHEINARSNASIRWAERAREAEQRVADLEGRLDRAHRTARTALAELGRLRRRRREATQDHRITAIRHTTADVLATKAPTRGPAEEAEEWTDEVMDAIAPHLDAEENDR